MKKKSLLFVCLFSLISLYMNAQLYNSAEVVSNQKFGEGLMVTRAKIVPMSGLVSNFFFFNREDEPWNDNVWYEYDWEIRGKLPFNGQAQLRVRPEAGTPLKSAPAQLATKENLGNNFYNYILIRKGSDYVYDIREDFEVTTYDYNNTAAHGGNSASILVNGPRIYTTGGNVADIPTWKQLDFSIGATVFANGWSGYAPDGSFSADLVVDYTRFYNYSGDNLNTNPQWQDEFNGNSLDYSKWTVANWTFRETQFTQNNLRFEGGNIIFRAEQDLSTGGSPSTTNLALNGTASQSSTAAGGSASRAIDNNTNGNWSNGSVTHTTNQTNAWWEVELVQNSDLDQIVLYNRTDCCSDRLSDFTVSVLDENDAVVWTQYYANTPSPSLTINLDAAGKTVRVNLNGILSLAEVKVFGTSISTNNLALDGVASQSSTGYGGVASRAIDNNTNGSYTNGSVTHTNNQSNTWWEVELAQNSAIDQIILYNRTDCCSARLSDFTVSVLDENGTTVWSQFYSGIPSLLFAINKNVTGKTVRVSLNGTLSLAEVQVFGTPLGTYNLALDGVASQSSTGYGGAASKAIDNNTNGNYNNGSVTHTNNQNNAWWEVELAQNSAIEEIVLYNRTNCCATRLSNFTVSVLDENGSTVWSQFYSGTPSPSLTINQNVTGKTVRVSLNGTLSLAEVQVFGSPTSANARIDETAIEIAISPNPAQHYINIDLKNFDDQNIEYIISSIQGQIASRGRIGTNYNETVQVDVSSLQNGMYLLYLQSDNKYTAAQRIVIMRD